MVTGGRLRAQVAVFVDGAEWLRTSKSDVELLAPGPWPPGIHTVFARLVAAEGGDAAGLAGHDQPQVSGKSPSRSPRARSPRPRACARSPETWLMATLRAARLRACCIGA
jgi:hypothetical protein